MRRQQSAFPECHKDSGLAVRESRATPYRSTVQAAAKIFSLLEAAGHLRTLCTAQDPAAGTPADGGPPR
jgi:hypothetical protein